MFQVWVRAALASAIVLLVVAACGGKEPSQRQAFIAFLQTRVLDVTGTRVPELTPEEKAKFGPYANDYAIITQFHAGMNANVTRPNNELAKISALRTVGEIVEQRKQIADAKAQMAKLSAALDAEQRKADAVHEKLKHPEDVKPVFDAAYAKLVTVPAEAYRAVFPAIDKMFGSSLKVSDYVQTHRNLIDVDGTTLRVADPATKKELGALLDQLTADSEKVNAAQRAMQEVVHGE